MFAGFNRGGVDDTQGLVIGGTAVNDRVPVAEGVKRAGVGRAEITIAKVCNNKVRGVVTVVVGSLEAGVKPVSPGSGDGVLFSEPTDTGVTFDHSVTNKTCRGVRGGRG